MTPAKTLELLSVLIPSRNEADSIAQTVQHLSAELIKSDIPHEIIVIDDNSTDNSLQILKHSATEIKELRVVANSSPPGFGRAIVKGISESRGDAIVIFMGDESDNCCDVVKYWQKLQEGYDCVFGSRFIKGSKISGYPLIKLVLNRWANTLIQIMFRHGLNDTTNAFKAYRKETIQGIQPIISPHFNITVELPLKAIVRGYSFSVIPVGWKNRKHGVSKLKLKEMGSRYLFIVLYVWLEKYFARGDYSKKSYD
jgi:dolichol-phosphate mannosyltransferase